MLLQANAIVHQANTVYNERAMMTSKSLFHANVAFVFPDKGFTAPENGAFGTIYRGKDAEGARFFDDPFARTKMLILPALGFKAVL